MIIKGANIQKIKVERPNITTKVSEISPTTITEVRKIKPMILEIKPMIIKPAKSSKLHLLPRFSVILFQGDSQERISCGIEKKCRVNQMKFNQT